MARAVAGVASGEETADVPPSQPAPEREPSSAFAHLGKGGAEDRLGFQLVVQILWRAVPLMRPVRGHLLALGGSLMVMVVLGLPVMLLMTDILSTRVLEGRVLTRVEARVLALDPDSYAKEQPDTPRTRPGAVAPELPMLTPEQRRDVRDRWLVAVFVMTVLGLPLVLPRIGAYAERSREGEGAPFYASGRADALADVLARLCTEPHLLGELRARLPASAGNAHSVAAHVATYGEALRVGAPRVAAADVEQRARDEAWEAAWDRSFWRESPPS